jgi:hypothetical protein
MALNIGDESIPLLSAYVATYPRARAADELVTRGFGCPAEGVLVGVVLTAAQRVLSGVRA